MLINVFSLCECPWLTTIFSGCGNHGQQEVNHVTRYNNRPHPLRQVSYQSGLGVLVVEVFDCSVLQICPYKQGNI